MADRPTERLVGGVIGGVIGRVAPTILRQVDLDAIVAQLDVDAIAEQLDLDALVGRLDVNIVADRLDLDALVGRLDVDSIAQRLDLDALVDRLDVNSIADRLDLDALVGRLDVNAIAAQLDLDEVVGRVDIAQLTAGATQDVAVSGLDLLRRQVVRIDGTAESLVSRIMRWDHDPRPIAPEELDRPDATGRSISGHYAGPVTRLLALFGDSAAAVAAFSALGVMGGYLIEYFGFGRVLSDEPGWLSILLFSSWMLLWFWVPVAMFGRTVVMGVAGIAVVRRNGDVVSASRALVRALVLPVSFLLLPLTLIGILFGRERRAPHDLAAGTTEVYDWGSRGAERPETIGDKLSARVRQRRLRADAEMDDADGG